MPQPVTKVKCLNHQFYEAASQNRINTSVLDHKAGKIVISPSSTNAKITWPCWLSGANLQSCNVGSVQFSGSYIISSPLVNLNMFRASNLSQNVVNQCYYKRLKGKLIWNSPCYSSTLQSFLFSLHPTPFSWLISLSQHLPQHIPKPHFSNHATKAYTQLGIEAS